MLDDLRLHSQAKLNLGLPFAMEESIWSMLWYLKSNDLRDVGKG